jgi:hypothetical protein
MAEKFFIVGAAWLNHYMTQCSFHMDFAYCSVWSFKLLIQFFLMENFPVLCLPIFFWFSLLDSYHEYQISLCLIVFELLNYYINFPLHFLWFFNCN